MGGVGKEVLEIQNSEDQEQDQEVREQTVRILADMMMREIQGLALVDARAFALDGKDAYGEEGCETQRTLNAYRKQRKELQFRQDHGGELPSFFKNIDQGPSPTKGRGVDVIEARFVDMPENPSVEETIFPEETIKKITTHTGGLINRMLDRFRIKPLSEGEKMRLEALEFVLEGTNEFHQ